MRKITYESTYGDYQLSRAEKNNEGFYIEILDLIKRFHDYVRRNYKKAFIFSFQLNFPAGYPEEAQADNAIFSAYIEVLRLRYYRDPIKPLYMWAREKSMKTDQFHYHVIFVVDGNEMDNDYFLQKEAKKLWHRYLDIDSGPFRADVSFIDGSRNGVMIKQSDPDAEYKYRKFFEKASYLAKVYSKGYSAPHVKEFGSSRIPKNDDRIFRKYPSQRKRDVDYNLSIKFR